MMHTAAWPDLRHSSRRGRVAPIGHSNWRPQHPAGRQSIRATYVVPSHLTGLPAIQYLSTWSYLPIYFPTSLLPTDNCGNKQHQVRKMRPRVHTASPPCLAYCRSKRSGQATPLLHPHTDKAPAKPGGYAFCTSRPSTPALHSYGELHTAPAPFSAEALRRTPAAAPESLSVARQAGHRSPASHSEAKEPRSTAHSTRRTMPKASCCVCKGPYAPRGVWVSLDGRDPGLPVCNCDTSVLGILLPSLWPQTGQAVKPARCSPEDASSKLLAAGV